MLFLSRMEKNHQMMKTPRKSKIAILFFLVFMASWLGLPGLIMDENTRILEDSEEDLELTSGKNSNTNRPMMYTFYEETSKFCCGMTSEGHQKLLDAWSRSWEELGWETKILTKADAMKHPDFDVLEEKLKKLGISEYDRRCYWRWLAMASVEGGGWMSDYDLFPLQLTSEKGNEIAQDGTFKSYALHVPCLIHASREEWDRIIHLMIDDIPDQREDKSIVISDMMSLLNLDLDRGRSGMVWSNEVAISFIYNAIENNERKIDCGGDFLAVHLSHAACRSAVEDRRYPFLEVKDYHDAVRRRAEAATLLMDDFRNEC